MFLNKSAAGIVFFNIYVNTRSCQKQFFKLKRMKISAHCLLEIYKTFLTLLCCTPNYIWRFKFLQIQSVTNDQSSLA